VRHRAPAIRKHGEVTDESRASTELARVDLEENVTFLADALPFALPARGLLFPDMTLDW